MNAIITDLPYGTTAASWDFVIPFDFLWKQVERLLVDRGVFISTASQPFTSFLVNSKPDWFRYELIWKKTRASGHLDARRRPMKIHENILVFGSTKAVYNPQMQRGSKYISKHRGGKTSDLYGSSKPHISENNGRFPTSVLEFSNEFDNEHPTQKPVDLYSYLALTYTNKNDVILDFTMGSGTTGVAALKLGRRFIGIEKDPHYFAIAEKRIRQAASQMTMNFE